MQHDPISPPLGEYALLLTLALLWGASFALIEIALASYPPATLAAIRISLGGSLILLVALWRGQQHIDSGVAGVINSTPPMFVFLITVFLLRSAAFELQKLVGVLLGLAGVALVAVTGSDPAVHVDASVDTSFLAAFAVLGASACYASGTIYGRRFGDQSTFVTSSCSLLCAATALVPISLIWDDPSRLRPELAPTLALLGLTVFSTALASLIFFRLVKTLGSLATSSNAYLRALVSILLGVLFLSEPFTWRIVVTTGLIFLGVFLVTGPTAKTSRTR